MLRLHRQCRDHGRPLRVVADQVGSPTATGSLARACWALIAQASSSALRSEPLAAVHHWSDSGVASWFDFAVAIGELGVRYGCLDQAAEVEPIPQSDYPTAAVRPSFSVLDCTATREALGIAPLQWRHQLEAVMQQLAIKPHL